MKRFDSSTFFLFVFLLRHLYVSLWILYDYRDWGLVCLSDYSLSSGCCFFYVAYTCY